MGQPLTRDVRAQDIMSNPKGIIISSTVAGNAGERDKHSFSISSAIDPAILKKHLLYWDSIAYPMINEWGPHFDLNPELEFLHSQGVLHTDEISINPADIDPEYSEEDHLTSVGLIPDLLAHGQLQLAKKYLNKNEVWSIAQVGGTLGFSSRNETSKNMLELSLSDGLPVPGDQNSFDDIINFRISHTNELNNLRTVLENLRKQVISSEEPDRTLVLVKEELYQSINDINCSLIKHKIDYFFDTLSVYLNVSTNQLTTTGLGVLLASGSGLPIEFGASIGIGTNIILKAVEREVRGAAIFPKEISDFMYLYTAKKHGIVS